MRREPTGRARELFDEARQGVYRRTDAMFGVLFVIQLIGGIAAALLLSPLTWAGDQGRVHVHVWAGLGLGSLLCAMPLFLILTRRGRPETRYTVAVAQMLFSALLIHLSGGRIETHFHVFGSLAFLAFYRDWKLLMPATAVVAADHVLRGVFWPESVFGVLTASPWRALEHAGWVVFEDVFLVASCVQARREMAEMAVSRAELEEANGQTERLVEERTRELRQRSEELARSEERFRLAVQGSQHGLWDWDLKSNTVYYAPRWKELLGCAEGDIGDSPDEWFRRVASGQLSEFYEALLRLRAGNLEVLDTELEMAHADGGTRWFLCRATTIADASGHVTRLAGSLADITELKHAQERMRELAHHDRLTGLPNRAVFSDRVGHALARARREDGYGFALLFGDFDGFKFINDSLGHAVGDAMLITVAQRFCKELRELDTVARLGGDEFAVLIDGVTTPEDAVCVAQRLVNAFARPFEVRGHQVVSTLSLGVVLSRPGYGSADEMLRDADAAMYQAKASGKSRWQLFDESMHRAAVLRLDTERDLRRATADMASMDREFRLVYQPIVDLSDARIVGFEALIRWEHPEKGLVRPDVFIPVAEETGTIIPIGEWTMRRACERMAAWRERVGPDRELVMNINLSRRQLAHPELVPCLERVIAETGVRTRDLKLEITETAMMDARSDAAEQLERIGALGIRLAMDDFGTGQSSLSCLRQFPIHTLKIDRAFLLNMTQHREFTAVMQAIITLADNLELDVVAEGIEDVGQLSQLQAMDCGYAQGYLFSRPVDGEEAWRLIREGLPAHRAAA